MRLRVVHKVTSEAKNQLTHELGEEKYNEEIKKSMAMSLLNKVMDNIELTPLEIKTGNGIEYEYEFKAIILLEEDFNVINEAIKTITKTI